MNTKKLFKPPDPLIIGVDFIERISELLENSPFKRKVMKLREDYTIPHTGIKIPIKDWVNTNWDEQTKNNFRIKMTEIQSRCWLYKSENHNLFLGAIEQYIFHNKLILSSHTILSEGKLANEITPGKDLIFLTLPIAFDTNREDLVATIETILPFIKIYQSSMKKDKRQSRNLSQKNKWWNLYKEGKTSQEIYDVSELDDSKEYTPEVIEEFIKSRSKNIEESFK